MKKNLLKSVLLALMVLVGGNAWAQTTTLMEYGTENVAWTTDNLAEWTAGGSPTITDGYVAIAGGNGSYSTSKTINPTENAIINVKAVWRGRSNTGRAFSAGNGSYFRFGNIIVAQNDQDKKHGYGFKGLSNIKDVTTFAAGSYRVDISSCTWLLIEMEINTASNTLTSFAVKSEDGNTTYASAQNVGLEDADYSTIAFGYHKSGSVSTANAEQLKSVKVTQTVQAVETANYTVKFVCNDTEVKEASVRTGVVGQNITLNSSDTENFYTDNMKYIYVSNDAEGKTVAEGAVVTVTFREAEKFAWTAKSSVGTYSISGETWEGDKATVKYPLYQLVEGKLWTKTAINQTYAQTFDISENNQELTLTYTETEIPAVFYAEVEDLENMSAYAASNAEARCSQRTAGYSADGNTLITSLPQGKYKMVASFYSPTSAGGKYNFFTGNRNIWSATTGNANATLSDQEVVLAKESNEISLGQGSYTQAVDYIYIQSLGEPTPEELAAAEAADALADAKAALGTAINEAKAIDTTDKEGVDALNTAITDAETALAAEDATVETLGAAKTALENAVTAFEEANAADPNDYTSYIVNADLTGEGGFDTTGTKGIDGSGIVKVGNAAAFDFKQTIANLPAGKYKVTAQAAYRYSGSEADEYAAIIGGTDTKLVQLYATVGGKTVSTKVQNRYDGASETDYANGNGSVTVNEKFVPNSSDAVKAWFAAGQYVNEVIFNLPADGAVTIGINRTGTPESDYTVIGPWTLTRIGDAEEEPEPAPEPGADMTSYITNPSFETGDLTGWTVANSSDTGVKPNSNATYTTAGCDGNYLFNTWWKGNPITQTVSGLPNGVYEMKVLVANDAGENNDDKPCIYLIANGTHTETAVQGTSKASFTEGSLQFNVIDGTATIGVVGGNTDGSFNADGYYWYKADNFRLTYVKGFDIAALVEAYNTALAAAQAVEGDMNADVKTALDAAIAAEVDMTNVDALTNATAALTTATTAAKASVAAYIKANEILPKMKELTESTNVYTAEALDAYYGQWAVKYNEKTLTTDEANALEDPFLVTGWRASVTVDNFLLSAWDTNPDFVDAPYYINTWSNEGNNDGSNFVVPFFEYWTGDGNSLGEKVLTGTMSGLAAGEYDVTAWVRVRAKNGYEAPAYGITMQANDGEAVDVAAGDQIGESQFFLKEFTATGTVAEDGVLNIKFNVAGDNNISWLSFKNVKFEKKAVVPEFAENVLYSWESPEGTPIEYGGTISYENGDGDRLNYPNSGYYTICLNGKKVNLDDEAASANAGHMVITLDNAVTEGDIIAITGYITKNTTSKSSAWIVYENGTTTESAVFGDESNIFVPEGGEATGTINTKEVIVSAEATGSKTITLTRGQTGTNLFITKLEITKGSIATGISNIASDRLNGTIYNLNGQKMDKAVKGLYIINGKKVVVK